MKKNPPIIKRVIQEMGGEILEIIPERGCFLARINSKEIILTRKFSIASTTHLGSAFTKYKDLTHYMLESNKLPTPRSFSIYSKTLSIIALRKKLVALQFPIIVKDAKGSNSKGIFPNITTPNQAVETIKQQLTNYPSLIVQEMVFGKEYRILMLDGRVIGALELIPPRVCGNGKDTIKQLLEKKWKSTEKKTPQDETLTRILHSQGYTLRSVPEKDQWLFVKSNSSLAEGGETSDVTDKVHPEVEKICARAAKVVGRALAGIDIMCEDIAQDPKTQSFNILEINGKPDIYIHYNPTHGQTRNVVKDILEFILSTL